MPMPKWLKIEVPFHLLSQSYRTAGGIVDNFDLSVPGTEWCVCMRNSDIKNLMILNLRRSFSHFL
jgi:hypothetical protein